MRLLTLDAALGGCSAGLVEDGRVLAEARAGRDQAATLPLLARQVLSSGRPDAVAVTVGPGSFTGLRAALSLAHGIGLAAAVPVLGVSVGDALAGTASARRAIWAAIDNRRGRVFLERGGRVQTVSIEALPEPEGPVAIVGDAAIAVMARLAARGADVQLLPQRCPAPDGIAAAIARGATRDPVPLYVDPPEARPGPAGRPSPA